MLLPMTANRCSHAGLSLSTQLSVTVTDDGVPDRVATHVAVQLLEPCFYLHYIINLD